MSAASRGDALRTDALQRKVKLQRFFGGVNRQIGREEYERLLRSDLTAEKNDLNVDEEKREL